MPPTPILLCPNCRTASDLGPRWFGCDTCRDPGGVPHWLEVQYDLEHLDVPFPRTAGRVWDYAPLLPVRDPAAAPSLGEGSTPLVRIDALTQELGLPNLYLKLEVVNPTGP